MDAAERRRDTRIRVAFQVLRAVPPLEGVAFLRDVSASGVRLEGTAVRPQLGQMVRLTVRPADRGALELIGAVVRHAEDGFGVELEKPCPELARLVDAEPLSVQVPTPAQARAGDATASQTGTAPKSRRSGINPFQEIAVDCCANTQWISGRICLPVRRTLLDHLNQGDSFVRAIDVTTPHEPDPQPFVALRTDALDLILPLAGREAVDQEQRVGNYVERAIRVLLPYALIEGSLVVLDKIRVSDHLLRCSSFVALRDCNIRLARGQQGPRDLTRVPILLVNARRVLGVSDLAASPPPPEDGAAS